MFLTQLLSGEQFLGPVFQTNFFTSRTWDAPADGIVVVRAIGAGGGGSSGVAEGFYGSRGVGGGSGAWGCKVVRVKKGDVITVTIGSRGAGGLGSGVNGQPGGDTIISINGVDYVAPGGHGGIKGGNSGAVAAALPDTWDFGANGLKGGSKGAGVDILAQGSLVEGYSWKTAGSSIPGNLIGDWSQTFYYGDDTEWGLCVVGGQAGANTAYSGRGGNGAPGADGVNSSGGSSAGGDGGICGGGGAGSRSSSSINGRGGSGTIGGGGGGGGEPDKNTNGNFDSPGDGGSGGNGYAHLKFFIYLEG